MVNKIIARVAILILAAASSAVASGVETRTVSVQGKATSGQVYAGPFFGLGVPHVRATGLTGAFAVNFVGAGFPDAVTGISAKGATFGTISTADNNSVVILDGATEFKGFYVVAVGGTAKQNRNAKLTIQFDDSVGASSSETSQYDQVVIFDDPATASALWAETVRPFLSSNPDAVGPDYVGRNYGTHSLKLVFDLEGDSALTPESDCYNDNGEWPYTSCFPWHIVQDDTNFVNGDYPDSAGRVYPNAPFTIALNDKKIFLDISGVIEIDQDADNDGVSEATQTDAVLFDFGGGYLAGSSYDQDQLLGTYTVGTLPAPSSTLREMVEVTDGATSTDCTVGGGTYTVTCIGSTNPHRLGWYAGIRNGNTYYNGTLGGSVILSGDLSVRHIDTLITGDERSLPNASGTDRFREGSDSTFVAVAYDNATYISGLDWTVSVQAQDSDDIAFVQVDSFGSIPPQFKAFPYGLGLGAWFNGTLNHGTAQNMHFRGYSYGILLGDPVHGDASPHWENCAALSGTDIDHVPGGSLQAGNDNSGREGTCSRPASVTQGLNIASSMSEGTTHGALTAVGPIQGGYIGLYAESASDLTGYPISFGGYVCDGTTGTTPLPKNSIAQEPTQCAAGGTGSGSLSPFSGKLPLSDKSMGVFEISGRNLGKGYSSNGDASGAMLIGPNGGAAASMILTGPALLPWDATSNEEFLVSAAIASSGGMKIISTLRPYTLSPTGISATSEYYNFYENNAYTQGTETMAVEFKSPIVGDDFRWEAVDGPRYVTGLTCLGEGNPIVQTVQLEVCLSTMQGCAVVPDSAVTVSASWTKTTTTMTPAVKVEAGEWLKLRVSDTTTAGASEHCAVTWHR